MFWSQTTIPGKPRLLAVDASCNVEGWEAEFCDRLFLVWKRKGITLVGESPLRADQPEDMREPFEQGPGFNCVFLFCHGKEAGGAGPSPIGAYWNWLTAHSGPAPRLLVVCNADRHDHETSQAILSAGESFAKLVVIPQTPLSPRAAGLFFMKFFAELDLHTSEEITGKMVWFSHSKAREILRRRQLPGTVGVRC